MLASLPIVQRGDANRHCMRLSDVTGSMGVIGKTGWVKLEPTNLLALPTANKTITMHHDSAKMRPCHSGHVPGGTTWATSDALKSAGSYSCMGITTGVRSAVVCTGCTSVHGVRTIFHKSGGVKGFTTA